MFPPRSPRLGLGLCAALALAVSLRPAAPPVAAASPPSAPPPAAEADPPPEDDAAEALAARLDTLLDGAAFLQVEGVKLGLSVVDLDSGHSVYARGAERALNPASNAKLVTTAAALARLGPAHRFSTQVWIEPGTRSGGAVSGKLYLQGGGDPSLVTGEIYELAGQLLAAGITEVRGPIVVDASRFDRDGLPPGFDQKDEFAPHRAPIGAMSVNYNTYEVFAEPAELVGEPPTLRVDPPVPGIVLDPSRATTVAGNHNKLWVSTVDEPDKTIVRFHGEVGVANGRSSYRYPVADPSRYAGELLLLALDQRGVEIRRAKVTTGSVPKDAKLVATHRSAPLSQLCHAVNKWSNNFMAEMLLRNLAPGAGAAAALDALRDYTREIAMPQAGLVLGNGSGLYDNNRVSPAALTYLLAHVHADFRYRSDYLASLAIMGADGTTSARLHQSPAAGWIRVKTGTLADVSALSGYAGAEGRAPFAFAILINGLPRKHRSEARALQDAIAETLALEAAREL